MSKMGFLLLMVALSAKNSVGNDCNIQAKSNFFRKLTNKNDGENNNHDEPKINPEYFKCGRKDSCTHVVKFKDTNTYQTVHGEAELKSIKRPIIVWEKQVEKKPKEEWIVIQRRIDASVDFNRNWAEYKSGFGNPCGNFWIGLEKLHALAGPCRGAILNITMKHRSYPNKLFYAAYTLFEIGNEADGYRLNIGGYSGNAGDSLGAAHDGMKFSTYDKDNDTFGSTNCAAVYKGGWWYKACMWSGLNNLYPYSNITDPKYMTWATIKDYGNIMTSEMKVKVSENTEICGGYLEN